MTSLKWSPQLSLSNRMIEALSRYFWHCISPRITLPAPPPAPTWWVEALVPVQLQESIWINFVPLDKSHRSHHGLFVNIQSGNNVDATLPPYPPSKCRRRRDLNSRNSSTRAPRPSRPIG